MTQNIQSRSKLDHQECLLMDRLAVQPNFLFRTVTDGLCKGLVYYPVMCEYVCGLIVYSILKISFVVMTEFKYSLSLWERSPKRRMLDIN